MGLAPNGWFIVDHPKTIPGSPQRLRTLQSGILGFMIMGPSQETPIFLIQQGYSLDCNKPEIYADKVAIKTAARLHLG